MSNEDAFETARKIAKMEGIFGGIISGANVWAAMRRARIIGAGKRIVTGNCRFRENISMEICMDKKTTHKTVFN